MRYYGIYVAEQPDRDDVADRLVDRRVCRAAAWKLVQKLNERERAARPDVPAHTLPLYYCCRDDEVGFTPTEERDE